MSVVMLGIIGAMVMVIIGYILGLRASGVSEAEELNFRLYRERRRLKAELWNVKSNASACIDEFASEEGKKWWKQWCENRIKVNREEDED